MTRGAAITLDWGPAQIQRLLPHRAPLLLVDRVARFVPGPRPRLRAGLQLRGDEPVFAAHFPGRPIWPGAYMLEGLAQAAGLLLALERVYGLHGGLHGVGGIEALAGSAIVDAEDVPRLGGLLARAEVRFVGLVEPPAGLVYALRKRGGQGGIERVDGRVELGEDTVAEASLVIALEPQQMGEQP